MPAIYPQAKLPTVAFFPANYFLENLVVRADNSALITAMNHKELWYVAPAPATESVKPILLHTFEQLTLNLVEVEPDVVYLTTSNVYTDHKSSLHRIDCAIGMPVILSSRRKSWIFRMRRER